MEFLRLIALNEASGNPFRQGDLAADLTVLVAEIDDDLAFRVRQAASGSSERSELRRDTNLREAGRGGTDAEERGEVVVDRMRAPGVAIGAGRLRHLQRGFETLPFQVEPESHAVQ